MSNCNTSNKAKKWTGAEVMKRRGRAQRLRECRRAKSLAKRKTGELALAREVVAAVYLKEEPGLTRSRWVTYAYMSALECTELFCKLYLLAYRNHYARVRDYLTADTQIPVSGELFQNDDRQITSFWRARQEADRLGMPYEILLNATMGWAADQKNRKQLLAPNQIYSAKALKVAQDRWKEIKDTVALFADDWDPRLFLGDEKAGLPRLQAMRLLHRRVNQSKHPEITLASYLERGAVDEALAHRMFARRPGIVYDALRRLSEPLPLPRADAATHVPGCFGLSADSSGPACTDCPVARHCHKLWGFTTAELLHVTGNADPLACGKRAKAAERKRRQRARERAAALAA